MCLEKPSFTERPIRPVRERIDLLKQDASLNSREKLKEIIHTEVRGGRGNRLISWHYSANQPENTEQTWHYKKESNLDKLESELNKTLMENLMYEPMFDYQHGSKPLDVWSNIEAGRDIYKFSRNEIHIMKNAGIMTVVGIVIAIFI